MNINWGLGQPVDISGAFQAGAQAGRQRRVEQETDNALRAFAQNPDDTNAVNALLRFNPQMGMQLREQQQTRQRQQRSQQQTGQALGGDMQSFFALAAEDPEQFARIRPQIEELNRTIGQVAQASNTPEEWDRNVTLLIERYGDSFRRYLGRFDQRRVAIAEAGQMQQFLDSLQPRITAIQQGGSVGAFNPDGSGGYIMGGPEGDQYSYRPQVDASQTFIPGQPQQAPQAPQMAPQPQTADPTTVAGAAMERALASRQISRAEASALAAQLGPNGQRAMQGWLQQNGIAITDAPAPPQVGEVRDGYRYLGGDPANPQSWGRAN